MGSSPHIPQQNKDSPIQKHKPPDPKYTYVDLLSAQESVQQMLNSGVLRPGEGQNTHQILTGMMEPRVPSFYPEGPPQRRAALATIDIILWALGYLTAIIDKGYILSGRDHIVPFSYN